MCYADSAIQFSFGVYVFIFLKVSCLSTFGSHFCVYTVDLRLRPPGHWDRLLLF